MIYSEKCGKYGLLKPYTTKDKYKIIKITGWTLPNEWDSPNYDQDIYFKTFRSIIRTFPLFRSIYGSSVFAYRSEFVLFSHSRRYLRKIKRQINKK